MAMLPTGFDASDFQTGAFTVLPVCRVVAAITESEKVAAKNGSGDLIKLVITITRGEFRGRKLFKALCLWHRDAGTREGAENLAKRISSLCGVARPTHTEQWHNIEFEIEIGLEKDDNGNDQNFIHRWHPLSEENKAPAPPPRRQQAAPSQVSPARQAGATAPAAPAAKPGWGSRKPSAPQAAPPPPPAPEPAEDDTQDQVPF